MKNKFKLLILLYVFFLTGCTVEYNVEIVNNNVIEKTFFTEKDISKFDDLLEQSNKHDPTDMGKRLTYREFIEESLKRHNTAFSSKGNKYYKIDKISNNKELGALTSYTFNIDEYKDSFMANKCFRYFNVIKQKETYIISTSKGFECFQGNNWPLDGVKIKLQTNHKVKSSNADEVDDYNYTWKIDKKNGENKSIYIEFYRNKYVFNYKNKIQKILIGVGAGIFGILLIYLIMRRKYRKTNRVV